MKIKSISAILCMLFILPGMLRAQENFVPGYIIDYQDIRTEGLVDYRNWDKNPDNIQFKTTADAMAQMHPPVRIREFGVAGDVYLSGVVDVEISSTQLDKLEYNADPHIIKDTLFLQAIVRGDKSLFYHKRPDGRENFYVGNEDNFELLQYKKYIKKGESQQQISHYKKYISQLLTYLGDCNTLHTELKDISYDQKSLTSLFKYYYDCVNQDIQFIYKKKRVRTEAGLLAGASYTKVNFDSDDFNYLSESDFPASVNFSAGIFLDIIFPKNLEKWSVHNEILYASFNTSAVYEAIDGSGNTTRSDMNIAYGHLNLNTSVRYRHLLNENLSWFFNTGLSMGIAFKVDQYRQVDSNFFSIMTSERKSAVRGSSLTERGILFGTGIRLKRFSGELRYRRGSGLSNLTSLASQTNRVFLLFGFRL